MYAIRSYYEDGTLEILGRRKNLRVIRIGNIERLQDFVGQRFVEFKSLVDGGQIVQCRITSYNVCYTKLLRGSHQEWLACL